VDNLSSKKKKNTIYIKTSNLFPTSLNLPWKSSYHLYFNSASARPLLEEPSRLAVLARRAQPVNHPTSPDEATAGIHGATVGILRRTSPEFTQFRVDENREIERERERERERSGLALSRGNSSHRTTKERVTTAVSEIESGGGIKL
jgi:hypothetical protein